MVYIVTILC